MNIRKPVDYSAMYTELDELMQAELPQMELYSKIGRLVSSRAEKGAAVAASEYLQAAYPAAVGFSPRNLRRMREFYRTYESVPDLMRQAMGFGWTQNVVIMEAELTMEERAWYLNTAKQFDWSKIELTRQIEAAVHLEIVLDCQESACYTEYIEIVREHENDKDIIYLPWQYLQKPDGRVYNEGLSEESWYGNPIPYRIRSYQHRGDRQPSISSGSVKAGRAWDQLCRQDSPTAPEQRLREIRPPDRYGSGQPTEYVPYMRRGLCKQDAPSDGLYRPSRRGGRSVVYRQLRGSLAGCRGRLPGAA